MRWGQRPFTRAPPSSTNFDLSDGGRLSLAELLQELSKNVVAHCVNVRHPLSLGHMHPPPAAVTVLGDLLIGALNQCAFIWEEAPLAAAVEAAVVQWLCDRVGLSVGAGGLLTSGGR